MTRLADLAKLIRSKNAGPFWITFDIMFESDANFERVAGSGVITKEWIAGTYNVNVDDIILVNHPAARAINSPIREVALKEISVTRICTRGNNTRHLLDLEIG